MGSVGRSSPRPRRASWGVPALAIAMAVGAVGALLPASTALAAAPTCTPAAPSVVGSGADRLTISVPGCASEAGLTGYRVQVLASASEAATTIDVPIGTTQREVTGLAAGTLYRFRVAARNADGAGPWSARSADAVPPFTSAAAMIDRQYRDFSTVAPTASQRSTWLADLGSGAKAPVDLVDAAEQLPYWQKQSPVIRLYQAYFLRLPDKSGLSYWVGKYRNGTKISDISQQFARSSEFTRRYGTLTNRRFVEQIYLNVLGRPGEASGIDYWTGRLDSKAQNRGQVMVGFSESSEYVRKTKEVVWTVNLFTGMLLRLPTTAEVTTWRAQTKAAQIAFLLSTATYVGRVGVAAPGAAPGITTTSLPGGRVGSAYAATATATGGTGALAWSRPSGSLPAGLSLSAAGAVTGTPSAAGTSTFDLRVTDAAGRATQRTFAITVTSFSITTSSLPTGVLSTPYSATLAATGGSGTLSWSIQSGTLPAGLNLSTAGAITGTPTAGGTANLTFKVTDAAGATATRTLALTVSTFGITTASLPNGVVGSAYAATIVATGGTGALSWSISSGALPEGLGLFDGEILGTPTRGGTSTFTVRVEDGVGQARQRSYSISIPALAVATAALPAGVISTPYAVQLAASNAYGATTWSVSSGSLPAGLSLDGDGLLSGAPTAGGTFNVTVRVVDDGGSAATKALSIAVSSFAIVTTSLPDGFTGVPYLVSLEAAGAPSATWSITAGALPAGLALSPTTGLISGTPTTSATSTFTARADAAGGKTASRQFTVGISATADWPQAGHDAAQSRANPADGAISAANVTSIGEEWNVESSLQPAIVGDRVYAAGEVPGRPGSFAAMALDLATGEVAWSGPQLPEGCRGGPVAVTATAVLVSCGRVLAYARSGAHELLWDTNDTDPGTSTLHLSVVGANAVAWTNDRVVTYRLSDGQRLWQQLLPSGAESLNGVAATGTNVIVAYSDRLRSLNPTTGAQQWSRSIAGGVAEVMIGGSSAYALVGGGLQRYALADGAPGWTVPASTGLYQLVGVDADAVYAFEAQFSEAGQTSSVVRAYRVSDGSERWASPLGTRVVSSAITKDLVWVHASEIFRWGRYSALTAFRRSDGVEVERIEFADNSYGPAAWGNGHVVISQGGSFGGPDPARLRSYGFTPPAPIITTTMVPSGRTATAYSAQLEATGGSGARSWSITSGSLPAGLALSPSGLLSGTPTSTAAVRVTVRVVDAKGRARSRSLFVQVLGTAVDGWSGEGRGGARDGWNPGEPTISRDAAAQIAFRWKTATPAGTEQYVVADHQPVVVGSRVIDIDKIGRLAAYGTTGTTANRAPQWTLTALDGATYPDAPFEAGGVLYLFDSNRALDAVRASDGVRLWHVTPADPPYQYQRNEVLVVGSRVLFLNGSYDLVARNASDGSAAWGGAAVALDGNELSGSVVLATDGTRAFVVANCEVRAITVATGAVAWTVPVKEGGTTNCGAAERMTPMVADGAVFASTYDGSISIEAATGVVRWRSGTRGGFTNGGGVIANGAWVLANGSLDEPYLVALDLRTGEALWQRTDAIIDGQFAVAGDLVIGRSTYGLAGFDLLTGEQVLDLGNPDPSAYTKGGPAIANGKIFVSTRDGIRAYGLP